MKRGTSSGLGWTVLMMGVVGWGAGVGVAQQPHRGAAAVAGMQKDAEGVTFRLSDGVLRVLPCESNTARVTFYAAGGAAGGTGGGAYPYLAAKPCEKTDFTVEDGARAVTVRMADLVVEVERESGALRFKDRDGKVLLQESAFPQPRQVKPMVVDGEQTNRASVWFALTPEEHFYGLGQHQHGLLNQRNIEMQLSQDNTNISIPFFLSSKGYGVFWNNPSSTLWNNRFQPVLQIASSVADGVDYFFINGPAFDSVIGEYRKLTGAAPLFPLWAYGYWQSRLAYASQPELLGVAKKYRDLHIPLDNIVLDEGWEKVLGGHVFTDKYPDPKTMVETLHDEHVHLMVSIWPVYPPGSRNFDDLLKAGLFVGEGTNKIAPYMPGTRLYDAFSAKGRAMYWEQAKSALYDIGVDAFWLDSSEPSDAYGEAQGGMLEGAKTAMGNGSRYANLFPFMTTAAMYDGQRSTTDQKRVFTLTRSAFAGMQHNAAAAWSGDIATNFATLQREIPAGLNYAMTGLPYWTTDIGGFVGGDTSDPAYQEVFVRWFQYGSFCPIFRVHGVRTNRQNELWSYGEKAQEVLTLYDRLRYRLMPYTYSMAARTTFDGYTPMRAFAFDFPKDARALDIKDEFMYGDALLVAPVTEAGAAARRVYLPAGAEWVDFWTGEPARGGTDVDRATPLAVMPLYVRAGSIVPMAPESEWTGEHRDGPVEVRVYPGKDAAFTLYDDDGATYNYEKGAFARVPMQWNEQARTLTIGKREGGYPGMRKDRDFSIVLVDAGHGTGEGVSASGRVVHYDGAERGVRF